ncbi:MAG: hypothetical protein H6Q89_1770 [Myxococcaceae bacterium]|nr:hypothetical protein [Myxococcaceae bacterium]
MPSPLHPLALIAALLGAADVGNVLKALGEDARVRERTAPCRYRETTTIEEIDPEGKVLGREVRVFNVQVRGMEVTQRQVVSVKKEGEPLPDLLAQPKERRGKQADRSPLHPQAQPDYQFELNDGPREGEQTVTIEPRTPGKDRVRGHAVVDARTHQLRSLELSPLKVPVVLKSLTTGFEYGDTACGRLPVALWVEGQGIPILIETTFRSRSVLEDHTPVGVSMRE